MDAEDAVSTAILELSQLSTFPLPTNPLGALFQVARHRLLDLYRASQRRIRLLPVLTRAYRPVMCDTLSAWNASHDLQYYMKHLSPLQQTRLLGMLEDGVAPTAQRLHCSPGAVKAGVHKARQHLWRVRHGEDRP